MDDNEIGRMVRLLLPPATLIFVGSVSLLLLSVGVPGQPAFALSPMRLVVALSTVAGLAWLMGAMLRLLWCEVEAEEGDRQA